MKSEYYNLYVEADEEVTTIISRLHLARSQKIALIIPQHSLVLQSIVNLRLLSREAGKQHKNITIVTQDDEGIAFASRVGLVAVPLNEWQEHAKTDEGVEVAVRPEVETYESPIEYEQTLPPAEGFDFATRELPAASHDMTRRPRISGMDIAPKVLHERETQQDFSPHDNLPLQETRQIPEEPERRTMRPSVEHDAEEIVYGERETISPAEPSQSIPRKKDASLFGGHKKSERSPSAELPDHPIKKAHHFGWFFACTSLLLVGLFLVLPLSFVTVRLGSSTISQQISLTAKTDFTEVDSERRKIPVRLIEKDLSRTLSVKASGTADVSAQKAYGTLTISNAFSGKSQDLVATTRFESPEGIIFRLVKNTTVPAMKVDGDTVIPGTVDVSVEADVPGKGGNITPTTWTIPGFANNNQKFKKFSAENKVAMTGGSAGGKGVSVVTQKDLDDLTKQAKEGVDEFIMEEIGKLKRKEERLVSGSSEHKVTRSESTVKVGTAVDTVEHVTTMKVKAFVFSEDDVNTVLTQTILADSGIEQESASRTITYSDASADFSDKKISLKADVAIEGDSNLDPTAFAASVRGKKHGDIKEILKKDYPYVNDIGIVTYPSFPSAIGEKFSRFEWMTHVKVDSQDR